MRFNQTMPYLFRSLRVMMFVAASCLVVNDIARLLFPDVQQALIEQICKEKSQDDNNSISGFSFFEEEVKHSGKDRFHLILDSELETAVAHLIKDDDVRHLAYIPIFTPPPDPA